MSHQFNITIKLENKDYCNGCPMLKILNPQRAVDHIHCIKYLSHPMNYVDNYMVNRLEICKQNEVSNDPSK